MVLSLSIIERKIYFFIVFWKSIFDCIVKRENFYSIVSLVQCRLRVFFVYSYSPSQYPFCVRHCTIGRWMVNFFGGEKFNRVLLEMSKVVSAFPSLAYATRKAWSGAGQYFLVFIVFFCVYLFLYLRLLMLLAPGPAG